MSSASDSLTGYRWLDQIVMALFVLVFGVTFIRAAMGGPVYRKVDYRMLGHAFISVTFWAVVSYLVASALGVI